MTEPNLDMPLSRTAASGAVEDIGWRLNLVWTARPSLEGSSFSSLFALNGRTPSTMATTIADLFYRGRDDVLLLSIDTSRVNSPLKSEKVSTRE